MAVSDRPQWAALPRDLIALMTIVAISAADLQASASVIGPVVLALVLTIAVHPVFTGLRWRAVTSWIAITVVLLAVFAIVLDRTAHGSARC
jgi:AI-2 transport protein TqsA